MKKLIQLILLLAVCTHMAGQSPAAFKYQAVLRNGSGDIVPNTNSTVDITILMSDMTTAVFAETHNVTTTEQGIINLEIGSKNDLSALDWGSEDYFLSVTIDGQHLGTTQLLSVPYALHARTAERTLGDSLWRQKNGNLYFNNGGIGIGTDIPVGKVAVQNDDLPQEEGSRINWMRLYGKAYNGDNLYLFHRRHTAGDNWNSSEVVIQKQVDSTPMHYISFKGEEANNASLEFGYSDVPYMTITKTGNVGIGVSDPGNYGLHVSQDKSVRMGRNINIADYDREDPDVRLISRDGNLYVWTGALVLGRWSNGDLPSLGEGNLLVQKDALIGDNLTVADSLTVNKHTKLKEDLEVYGSTKVGYWGVEIEEIREFTGTTPNNQYYTYVSLPAGWTVDNCRILSSEFRTANSSSVIWEGPVIFSGSYSDLRIDRRAYLVYNEGYNRIFIKNYKYEGGEMVYENFPFRITVMKIAD